MNDTPVERRGVTPLLRWAGGKRWMAEAVRAVGNEIRPVSYVEPFAGGAAVFFNAFWQKPVLNDTNRALMACYRGLAADPRMVRSKLRRLKVDRETYSRVARWHPKSDTGAAARLLYLNRTAYGGVYRENKKGEYNVPFAGDRSVEPVLAGRRLEEVGSALSTADLRAEDFEAAMDRAADGALVYCDPPYSLPGGEHSFRRYNRHPFAWPDQVRLAAVSRRLIDRGCVVIISNSHHEIVRNLYQEVGMLTIARTSTLGPAAARENKEAIYVLALEVDLGLRVTEILSRALS